MGIRQVAGDGEVLVGVADAGVVDADHLAVGRHQRTAGVARVDGGVDFENIVNRCPVGLAVSLRLGDDAPRQGVLLVAEEREACRVDLHADVDRLLVPDQRGVAVAVNVDDGQVGAFGDAEDPSVARAIFPGHVHFEEGSPGDDVVVGHGDAFRIDDEAATLARRVEHLAEFRVDKAALSLDANGGVLDVFQCTLGVGHLGRGLAGRFCRFGRCGLYVDRGGRRCNVVRSGRA